MHLRPVSQYSYGEYDGAKTLKFSIQKGRVRLGIIEVYLNTRQGFAYLETFKMYQRFRGYGYGKEAFFLLRKSLRKRATRMLVDYVRKSSENWWRNLGFKQSKIHGILIRRV